MSTEKNTPADDDTTAVDVVAEPDAPTTAVEVEHAEAATEEPVEAETDEPIEAQTVAPIEEPVAETRPIEPVETQVLEPVETQAADPFALFAEPAVEPVAEPAPVVEPLPVDRPGPAAYGTPVVVDTPAVAETSSTGPSRRRLRVGTVVWGLVIAACGLGVIAWAGGARIDLQLALIVLLAVAGAALLVGSIVSGTRNARR